jgi:hypothetical protein
MSSTLNPPFNLFVWSFGLVALFFAVQTLISVAYALAGYTLSPPIAVFTWFSLSTALGYSLHRRCSPETLHMVVLQGLAAFYIFVLSAAANAVTAGGLSFAVVAKAFGAALLLFLCGAIGFSLAHVLRHRSWV